MTLRYILQSLVGVLLVQGSLTQDNCHDVDSHSCRQLLEKDATFCDNLAIAGAACPYTCGQCSHELTCYHCDDFVESFEVCNTTKLCQKGQKCMSGLVLHSNDGYQEYSLQCATDEICDGFGLFGTGVGTLVGRRDVSTHCCNSDLCNDPAKTTTMMTSTFSTRRATTGTPVQQSTQTTATSTHLSEMTSSGMTPSTITSSSSTPIMTTQHHATSCTRDVLVFVEKSEQPHHMASDNIKAFLIGLVNSIAIGQNANELSLSVYSEHLGHIKLDEHQTRDKLIHDINHLHFEGHGADTYLDVLQKTLDFITDPKSDRLNVPDILIFISDQDHRGDTLSDKHHNYVTEISRATRGIIVINVGAAAANSPISILATDPSYKLNVPGFSSLPSLRDSVLNLMCR